VLHRLVAPADVSGAVAEDAERPRHAPIALEYAAPLLRLDPPAASVGRARPEVAAVTAGGLVFRSPLSGRFYRRASPTQPPFVEPGDVVRSGQTIALLEVMKTFNRVTFGGPHLPPEARVKRILPEDESDLDEGDPILELEPIAAPPAPKSG
jgi:acetyl-CoA carboxylase biotin carboxyl carrier protein